MNTNTFTVYSTINQDKWEFVPPNGPILLVNPHTFEATGGYSHVHIDNMSIKGHKTTSEQPEPMRLYYEYAQENTYHLVDRNAFVAVWSGDHKLYLAVCYAYEGAPFYTETNPNFTLHTISTGKLARQDDKLC